MASRPAYAYGMFCGQKGGREASGMLLGSGVRAGDVCGEEGEEIDRLEEVAARSCR